MDEGGIYEDGTPEEIFEHPKRENTRRFVRSGGSRLDGTPDEENLSIQLIQSAVKNVEIGREEGSELPNRIVLQIRSEEQEPGNRFLSEGEDTG